MKQITFNMTKTTTTFYISDDIGSVSGQWLYAKDAIAQMVIGHGAGAGMYHPFMKLLAVKLQEQGISTLRYQFPYMEAGKKMPDRPKKATKTIEEIIKAVHQDFPNTPLFAAGKSFGGRMTSQLLSEWQPDYIKGLVFYGFPLHAPGKPSTDRADHLKEVKSPMFFLQGTRDKLATPELLNEVTKPLSLSTVKYFDGADHSFAYLKKSNINVDESIEMLALATRKWIDSIFSDET
ncbi:alpha/beta hydrolase family protein [Fulvivirga sediminis]|uniref:Dienelactone hydrolase family protein n=1 Tax=Fulvivirga sediminis TaxID=2803949 RepID=A0A937F9A2_9BACT|nr:alpha/beta family hydrolase [Fulvivirga sediminis]MBL3657367.1 dienelactone hydrolase family protein [Fulvivirga sediminis]